MPNNFFRNELKIYRYVWIFSIHGRRNVQFFFHSFLRNILCSVVLSFCIALMFLKLPWQQWHPMELLLPRVQYNIKRHDGADCENRKLDTPWQQNGSQSATSRSGQGGGGSLVRAGTHCPLVETANSHTKMAPLVKSHSLLPFFNLTSSF